MHNFVSLFMGLQMNTFLLRDLGSSFRFGISQMRSDGIRLTLVALSITLDVALVAVIPALLSAIACDAVTAPAESVSPVSYICTRMSGQENPSAEGFSDPDNLFQGCKKNLEESKRDQVTPCSERGRKCIPLFLDLWTPSIRVVGRIRLGLEREPRPSPRA
jgi:hypothetical protein